HQRQRLQLKPVFGAVDFAPGGVVILPSAGALGRLPPCQEQNLLAPKSSLAVNSELGMPSEHVAR
ncbi:MAG: hypothetical protein ACRD0P_08385, partial [Stackebrandtia sp.]